MNVQSNNQPEERSLVPTLPTEDTITAEFSLQEATLIRGLLAGLVQHGSSTAQSDRAWLQTKLSAMIALGQLAGPNADPGLPSLSERSWPKGTTFYQFTTFDMEAFIEYTAFLPATEAVTSYLFSPQRRKADADLIAELVSHGNRFAKEAPENVIEHRLNVNNSGIAWNRRRPDALIDYKARNLNYFAPILAAPPAEGKVLESFAITS